MSKASNKPVARKDDLPDSDRDKDKLQGDEGILDLPDVSEIPGQEHVKPPMFGEMADTTISSDDEEGVGILDDPDEDDEELDVLNTNVTKDERKALDDATDNVLTTDEDNLQRAKLDNVDEDGEELNESIGLSGDDLDVPGSEDDDANEMIGEEDEENNNFSLDSDHEDENTNRD